MGLLHSFDDYAKEVKLLCLSDIKFLAGYIKDGFKGSINNLSLLRKALSALGLERLNRIL
jgi:hypothetical protein